MSGFKANLLSFTTGIRHGVSLPDGAVAHRPGRTLAGPSGAGRGGPGPGRVGPLRAHRGRARLPGAGGHRSAGRRACAGASWRSAPTSTCRSRATRWPASSPWSGRRSCGSSTRRTTEAFVADADLALEQGRFPAMLTYPLLHLADPGALGLPTPSTDPACASTSTVTTRPTSAPTGWPSAPVGYLDAEAIAGLAPPPAAARWGRRRWTHGPGWAATSSSSPRCRASSPVTCATCGCRASAAGCSTRRARRPGPDRPERAGPGTQLRRLSGLRAGVWAHLPRHSRHRRGRRAARPRSRYR